MENAAGFVLWDSAVKRMAEQAEREATPVAPLQGYLLYAAVRSQTAAFAKTLPAGRPAAEGLFAFCLRDLQALCAALAPFDPELTVLRYFACFRVRSGNPDTPDDRVNRLDEDRFLPYRQAREKQWRGEPLASGEQALLQEPLRAITEWFFREADALRDGMRSGPGSSGSVG